jgi:hypothetical protein
MVRAGDVFMDFASNRPAVQALRLNIAIISIANCGFYARRLS